MIRSIITSVGLPTSALLVLLYAVGRNVSPTVYRLAALVAAAIGGCRGVFGDQWVLAVLLVAQLLFGLLVSKPKVDYEETTDLSGMKTD
ncbi:hypothetical protein [Micromonospora musae]|uniref:hypothetical protein n=1 Tax=Micromonospora musae TaxID=1894970 RepID=UPI00342018C6